MAEPMSGPGSVRLEDAGKRYVKYDDTPMLLNRAFRLRSSSKKTHLWAIRHVDLEVKPGETVGVIGRNGSGKSTMLRMLAGVTAPTEGTVVVQGRVAPLIAVGVGFHPELTGRENVYVNATVLGLARPEIDRLFDSIVHFAEIEPFIDTPVKFYSSGMFVRLGFSVAIASRPDVLLVDEVLAVGDLAFQTKCFERMNEIRTDGTSVLVVSHNLNAVRLLCQRTMVLHNGDVRFVGESHDAISTYHELLGVPPEEGADDEAGPAVQILSMTITGEDGEATNHVRGGERLVAEMEAEFARPVSDTAFSFVVSSESGQIVYSEFTADRPGRRFQPGDRARFEVRFPAALPSGSYRVKCGVHGKSGEDPARAARYKTFFVSGRPFVKGLADLGGSLHVEGGTTSSGGPEHA